MLAHQTALDRCSMHRWAHCRGFVVVERWKCLNIECSTFLFDSGNVYFRCLSGSHIRHGAADVFLFQRGPFEGFTTWAAARDKGSVQSVSSGSSLFRIFRDYTQELNIFLKYPIPISIFPQRHYHIKMEFLRCWMDFCRLRVCQIIRSP